MNNKKFAIFIFTFFLFYSQILFANNKINSNKNLVGVELCDSVFNILKKEKLNPKTQSLLISGENNFPYNIILEKDSSIQNESIDTKNLIIQICMEEFFVAQQEITDICKLIKRSNFSFNIIVAITYGDNQIINKSNKIQGTDVFIKSIFENQNSTAILLNFSENKNQIIANGSKKVSPLWMLKTCYYSYKTQNINQNLSSFILSQIYKFSFLNESPLLQNFLNNNIQSIELSFDNNAINENKVLHVIQYFINNFEQHINEGWDQNFLMIKLFNQYYWLSETSLVIFIIIFTCFILIFLFLHYILNKNVAKKYLFSSRNINHLPFLILLILFFCSNFGSTFFTNLLNFFKIKNSHFYSILFMFSLSYFCIFALYEKTIFFGKQYKEKALDLQATIISFINLITFSLIDITLFPLFLFEFFVFAICYNLKIKKPKLLFFIISILVFAPYAYTLFLNIDIKNITNILVNNSYFAFCLLLVLTPILVLLLRIISFWTKLNKFSFIKAKFIFFGIFISLLVIANLLIQNSNNNNNKLRAKNNQLIKISDLKDSKNKSNIFISYSDETLFEDTVRTLNIEFTQQPVQCDITITSDYKPILYSNNEYNSSSLTTSSFAIPYYPPKKMTFEYGTNSKESFITINAIFEKSDYNYIMQTEKIAIVQNDQIGQIDE